MSQTNDDVGSAWETWRRILWWSAPTRQPGPRIGTFFELPAFPVQVVDTTGCGDVFHGAYALAMARRRSCF